ncbi:MAG: beta-lactamase family protein [Treponema sp.]|jgi:CubicO group peptidase (beta-lactamase class C family)|nr:beta-lactamase family protein [Treponema sp.]
MGIKLESAAADEAGLNRAVLDDLFRALERSPAELRGLVLVRHGKVLVRRFWEPYREDDPVWVYSLSKSFCSTAVGFAVEEGLLRLNERVLSFFPEYEAAVKDENCRAMTVQDLLTMRTGHETDTTFALTDSPNWAETFFRLPVKYQPGTHFVYNSGASYMLSALTQKRCGLPVVEYLKPRLFDPLGFAPVSWDSSPQGINTGGWGFMVTLEDIAKFGLLYLNRGTWRGKRIIGAAWVDEAALPHADNSVTGGSADWSRGYGYQFWRSRYGFRGDGAFGQYCLVLPEFDAVLALSSETADMQGLLDIIWTCLPPSFAVTGGEMENRVENREFRLSGNDGGFSSASLTFRPDHLILSLDRGGEKLSLKAGRFGWLESETRFPLEGYSFIPVFSSAGGEKKVSASFLWRDAGTLEIRLVYRTSPHRELLTVKFRQDSGDFSVTISYSPNTALQAVGRSALCFEGRLA